MPVGVTKIVADACFVLSAWLTAVTVTDMLAVTVGAVNMPPAVMVPALAFHALAELLVLVTVALNCWLPPDKTVVLSGEIAIVTGALVGGVVWEPA
jgi:hypothetical protein